MISKESQPEEVIRLEGLSKSFRGHLGIGKTLAVVGLDLAVRRGEVFGLLGPNGAGKTTTLKMILGLLRPDGGRALLFGGPSSDPSTRARIGYLPENPYFYDYLTAEEFLDFYGRLQGVRGAARRAMTKRAMGMVGLRGKERTPLRKFSKGMIQRVGLAQAIQHDPDLVILDEPMSGLDPVGRREVRDLILKLRADGRTVFFSSHILQDAEMICDRVAILDRGRLRSVGMLREMVSDRTRWFEVAARGPLPELPGCERISGDAECILVRVADVESLGYLLAAVRESDGQVLSIWPRRETLEDLFMREIVGERGGEKLP
jgi:ABC-2 type transport system ATP-binding protein